MKFENGHSKMNIFVAILSYNAHSSSFCPFLCFYCFFSFPCSLLSAPKSPTAAKRRPHCQHVPPTPDIPVVKVRLVPEANRHDVKKVRKISQNNLLLFVFRTSHTARAHSLCRCTVVRPQVRRDAPRVALPKTARFASPCDQTTCDSTSSHTRHHSPARL
jgi:hypothetical protein